ncbi:hypothetical protein [uncultured Sphingomonas sp.]|uniref:hypothetical protein n=1 Tax=uncultured Sphingomonas sp. TaxID=158754 RepID=UPI0035CAC0BD
MKKPGRVPRWRLVDPDGRAVPMGRPGRVALPPTRFGKTLPGMASAADQHVDELTFIDRLRHIGSFIGRRDD